MLKLKSLLRKRGGAPEEAGAAEPPSAPAFAPGEVRFLKVFGERNTGTNWCEQNLEANTAVEIVTNRELQRRDAVREGMREQAGGGKLGKLQRAARRQRVIDDIYAAAGRDSFDWKHCAVVEERLRDHPHYASTAFVCMTKHPVWFVSSLHRRPYAALGEVPDDLAAFVARPWQTVGRENLDGAELSSPVELWNRKVRSYFEFVARNPRAIIVKYEDLLADPDLIYRRLSEELGVPLRRRQKMVGSNKRDELTFEEYREKYSDANMRRVIPEGVREAVERRADPELVARLGYRF